MSFSTVSNLSSYSSDNRAGSAVLNTPERHKWQQASWPTRLFHGKDITQADKDFFSKITDYFKKRIGISSDPIFEKVWKHALASHQISWRESDPLSIDLFKRIDAALKDTLVYHGKGVDTDCATTDAQVHGIVRYLLGKGEPSSSWLTEANILGILVKKDPQLLHGMQVEFQNVLTHCGNHLPQIGSKEEVLFEAFIGNVVALLPYCYPVEGDCFTIPRKVDGAWHNISYTVDRKIELTPSDTLTPIVAFGLVSKPQQDTVQGPPLLTFLGTTFPGGDGFTATVLSDFTPGYSVGNLPYLLGKHKMDEWMKDKTNVQAFGMSLGGAFTFHLLRNHKEKLGEIHAYSPPGLYEEDWKEEYHEGPKINIYCQRNDIVPMLGVFPKGKKVTIYQAITGLDGQNENKLGAHARVFTGFDHVTLLKSSAEYENSSSSRKMLTTMHKILSFAVFLPVAAMALLFKAASRFFSSKVDPLINRDIRSIKTTKDLESLNPDMQKHLPSEEKFSHLVFGEYYQLCKQKGLISSEEQTDVEWGRHHFEKDHPIVRTEAIAHVLQKIAPAQEEIMESLVKRAFYWGEIAISKLYAKKS